LTTSKIIVHKNRTNILALDMGMDVSGQTITSEIRSEADVGSPLLATWIVTFATDGKDGQLVLRIDDNETSQIKANSGYMDLKRIVNGEPMAVFDSPLEVTFRGSVTL
jgi:hypothetical protein